jgi:lipopolysaccharide export system protein LptA
MNRLPLAALFVFCLAVWAGAVTPGWAASSAPKESASAAPRGTASTAHSDKSVKPRASKASKEKKDSKGAAANSSPFTAFTMGQGRGPVNISSDSLSLDYKGKTVLFTGHVRAIQANGGQQLTCDKLKVVYGKNFNDMQEMIADGDVRISQGTRWVTGDHAVMNQTHQTVVLTGSPVVHDGTDQITGSKITVHLDTGKSEVENARAVIFPKRSETTDNVMAGSSSP